MAQLHQGALYGIGRFESDSPLPSQWKFLFDMAFNIEKINDITGVGVVAYNFVGHVVKKSTGDVYAMFIGETNHVGHRFNDQKEFVLESVYRQLFVSFDEEGSLQIMFGLSNSPKKEPYYSRKIATLPLRPLPNKFWHDRSCPDQDILDLQAVLARNAFDSQVEVDKDASVAFEQIVKQPDIADRDLDDQAILLLFADGFT